jgi:mono/diheme cytochrome c family protein
LADRVGVRQITLHLIGCLIMGWVVGGIRAADEPAPNPSATFKQYCFACHGNGAAAGSISLSQLTAKAPVGENFQAWEKVAAVLESNRMPPKGMPQPPEAARRSAVAWIRGEMEAFARKNAGDPGRVTVRRLTSGEYAYAIEDLTGYKLDVGVDATSDSVGGEGFTNFGDVQFMQDANLQRYLDAAKQVSNHAVVGAGPIEFYSDPGKTGLELSALNRLTELYRANAFRTVSGEGGRPFGLERYGKAFYTAWQYRHRKALGLPETATVQSLAVQQGITPRFAQHIYGVLNTANLGYPSSEVAARWKNLPVPGGPDTQATEAAARKSCEELQKWITTWPSWLFARGDVAAGGAGDESPLEFSDRTLKAEPKHAFVYGGRGGGGAAGRGFGRGPAGGPTPPQKVYFLVEPVNPGAPARPIINWRNATVAFRPAGAAPGRGRGPAAATAAAAGTSAQTPVDTSATGGVAAAAGTGGGGRRGPEGPPLPRVPLRSVVKPELAARLSFGKSLDGKELGPDDFSTEGKVALEIPIPEGFTFADLRLEAELGGTADQVLRIIVSDREDGGGRGTPMRVLLADPQGAGYKAFRAGITELAALLPPNSHGEPNPADKDPVPEPFDNTYNVPEHDEFIVKVKYVRDDRFVRENMVDGPLRKRLDDAWNDLFSSFDYHDTYLRLLAKHYRHDLKDQTIARMDKAAIAALPAAMQPYVTALKANYDGVMAAERAARSGHVSDCLALASRAWRRPLTEGEKQSLRSFYDKTLALENDHAKAVRALIARILVSPAFLYRVELASAAAPLKPVTDWELASRLSFFLWSSIPDTELRRAAAAGELSNPRQLEKQVKRMLADSKARRLSTEFFGQWLGFYHFDEFRGVDTSRYKEFTDEVKQSMYDEAVSFFEYIVRNDRPVKDMLFADYAFLNQPLARYYGVKREVESKDAMEKVDQANSFDRGGLLRLGAILTTTSAPLRTSPVKRGDWVLRRILGTPVPPPPPNVPKLPADDKAFGGMTIKQRLEAHKQNVTCAGCHVRIDPLGFPLEKYDSTGRVRDKYADGNAIDDTSELTDKTPIKGVKGLLDYLATMDQQVRRTFSRKLVGFALGRTVQASDQALIDNMVQAGGDAGLSQLVYEIVSSKQFRNRLGQAPEPGKTAAVPRQRAALIPLALSSPTESQKAGGNR